MKNYAILTALFILFTVSSCSNKSENAPYSKTDEVSSGYVPESENVPSPDVVQTGEAGNSEEKNASDIPLKIIKEAELGFETSDYAISRKKITEAAAKYKGYISKENEQTNNYRISNEIIIRVPNASVELLMNEIASGAKRVDYKRMNLTDVTEEFVDLETRLKTKKEVELRYIDILHKAQSIKDILAVEDQLRVIREEIEASEGRLKYLNNRVDLSTLYISVYQELEYKYIPENQPGFFERALKSLDNGWRGLLEALLGLVNLWPLLLLLVFLVVIFSRWRKRRKAMKK